MQKPQRREENMHGLKHHIWDIYAALVIIGTAAAVGGLQLVLPQLI